MRQTEVLSMLEYAGSEYGARFRQEFAGRFSAHVGASAESMRGRIETGVGYDTVWTPGANVAAESKLRPSVRASFASRHLGAAATVQNDRATEFQAVMSAGPTGVWAGRRQLGYAPGASGGMVVDRAQFDGGGVFLTRPIDVLFIKRIRFETQLTRVHNVLNLNRSQFDTKPWFWNARGSFEPHPRLRFGITRGMMFGGEGNLPVTFKRVVENLIGVYTANDENSFANQNLSVDARYRVPVRSNPLTLYAEWGAEDAAGGWWKVPGLLAGIEYGVVTKNMSAGIERTEFLPNFGPNSIWYQNAWFRGGWADAGSAIGHPLGGHGAEWRVFANGDFVQHRVTADLALYARRRGAQNLYSPAWRGRSFGGEARADASLTRSLQLSARTNIEEGRTTDWSRREASVALRFIF